MVNNEDISLLRQEARRVFRMRGKSFIIPAILFLLACVAQNPMAIVLSLFLLLQTFFVESAHLMIEELIAITREQQNIMEKIAKNFINRS